MFVNYFISMELIALTESLASYNTPLILPNNMCLFTCLICYEHYNLSQCNYIEVASFAEGGGGCTQVYMIIA